jgi:lipopolysaccharide export system ATP-binding protein
MIVGLVKPNAGENFLDDVEITDEPVFRKAQRGIGYLVSGGICFPQLSVEENIKAVLEMTSFSKEYQAEKTESLLNEFGLQKIRKSLGIQLSVVSVADRDC